MSFRPMQRNGVNPMPTNFRQPQFVESNPNRPVFFSPEMTATKNNYPMQQPKPMLYSMKPGSRLIQQKIKQQNNRSYQINMNQTMKPNTSKIQYPNQPQINGEKPAQTRSLKYQSFYHNNSSDNLYLPHQRINTQVPPTNLQPNVQIQDRTSYQKNIASSREIASSSSRHQPTPSSHHTQSELKIGRNTNINQSNGKNMINSVDENSFKNRISQPVKKSQHDMQSQNQEKPVPRQSLPNTKAFTNIKKKHNYDDQYTSSDILNMLSLGSNDDSRMKKSINSAQNNYQYTSPASRNLQMSHGQNKVSEKQGQEFQKKKQPELKIKQDYTTHNQTYNNSKSSYEYKTFSRENLEKTETHEKPSADKGKEKSQFDKMWAQYESKKYKKPETSYQKIISNQKNKEIQASPIQRKQIKPIEPLSLNKKPTIQADDEEEDSILRRLENIQKDSTIVPQSEKSQELYQHHHYQEQPRYQQQLQPIKETATQRSQQKEQKFFEHEQKIENNHSEQEKQEQSSFKEVADSQVVETNVIEAEPAEQLVQEVAVTKQQIPKSQITHHTSLQKQQERALYLEIQRQKIELQSRIHKLELEKTNLEENNARLSAQIQQVKEHEKLAYQEVQSYKNRHNASEMRMVELEKNLQKLKEYTKSIEQKSTVAEAPATFDQALKDQLEQNRKLKDELIQKDQEIERLSNQIYENKRKAQEAINQAAIEKLKYLSQVKKIEQKYDIQMHRKDNQLKTMKHAMQTLQGKLLVAVNQNKTKDNFLKQYLVGRSKTTEQKDLIHEILNQYRIEFNVDRIGEKILEEQQVISQLQKKLSEK